MCAAPARPASPGFPLGAGSCHNSIRRLMRLTALWPSCWPSSLLTAGGPASPPLATCSAEVFLEVEMGACFLVPLSILQTPSIIPPTPHPPFPHPYPLLRSGAHCFLGLKALLATRSAVQPINQWNWGTVQGREASGSCFLPAQRQYHLPPSQNHNSTWFTEPSRHPPKRSKDAQC